MLNIMLSGFLISCQWRSVFECYLPVHYEVSSRQCVTEERSVLCITLKYSVSSDQRMGIRKLT